MRDHGLFGWHRRRAGGRTTTAMAIAAAVAVLATGCATVRPPHAAPPVPVPPVRVSTAPVPVPPVRVSAAQMARLRPATTDGSTPAAPPDPAPFTSETGIVLHREATRVVYARPGGPPVAA